ncbi:MAG: GNAT family N-acetyltransferase, partial [Deltaproteobacteria bacterium]|nr:GNAT family N-acetyltransferase [Deltaproteobacteria bacterium]
VIMLYNGNEPIGYCWTIINSEENSALKIKKGRIHMMGVDPDYRGKGLGKAVLSAGLTHLMERGIELAELTVDSSNTVACSLYKSVGFEIRATTLWYEKDLT